jgi:hypothetical protein
VSIYVHLSEPSPRSIMATRPGIVVNEWNDNPSFSHLVNDTLEVRRIREYSGRYASRILVFGLI